MIAMKRAQQTSRILGAVAALFLTSIALAQQAEVGDWQKLYEGEAATGENVIALWQFDGDTPLKDVSGNGHDAVLHGGAKVSDNGKFGSALESTKSFPPDDIKTGASIKNAPALTPKGPFTIELWMNPKPEFAEHPASMLIDKKYIVYKSDHELANKDYAIIARKAGDLHRLDIQLGFGDDYVSWITSPVKLEAGQWYHLAFTYDGKGTGKIYLNGVLQLERTEEGRGDIADGPHALIIGDRVGSNYLGCPAYIDQVRITNIAIPFTANQVRLNLNASRTVFRRMETDAQLAITVVNDRSQPLDDASLNVTLTGMPTKQIALPALTPGEKHATAIEVNTALRPGKYEMTIDVEGANASVNTQPIKTAFTISPRPTPGQMPVVMWGAIHNDLLKLAKDLGFTHTLINLTDYKKVFEADQPVQAEQDAVVKKHLNDLDNLLAQQLDTLVYIWPGSWLEQFHKEYTRIDRNGNHYKRHNICGLFDKAQQFCYNAGASVSKTYGNHPVLAGALIHSEIRDSTALCFHEHDRNAFREFAGYSIPKQAITKRGVNYRTLPNFPTDHVIADDNPLLTYYRWFWTVGDGWNNLHTQVDRGLKSNAKRADFWTFFDPAARAPSIAGSGGGVDYVSQWTYSFPDPIKIGFGTDELIAMAEGSKHDQDVMKMTQIIWYRSQTAPAAKNAGAVLANQAEWEKEKPDAQYITIAPDHLREALWSKISRPIKGIMYHGWQSLVPGVQHRSYEYTNAQTSEVLAELMRDVVQPLGPTLLQVPDRPADVAFLESFTSQMFAGRGTYGWTNGWPADAYLILRHAQLQPQVLYEDTLVKSGLNDFKVLVLMDCDVLTRSVADAIIAFQNRGGIVIADENLAPAIVPDVVLESFKRTKKVEQDKQTLLAKAAELRSLLDPHYQRFTDSNNARVVTRARQFGSTDYVFAINDHRTFGDYVGQHRLVMEKGLPSQATVRISRPNGHVYDLVAHQRVQARHSGNELSVDLDLGPTEGKLLMVTDHAIDNVQLKTSDTAARGQSLKATVRVADAAGNAINAVVPVKVELLSPAGDAAELSGYYGAADGTCDVTFDIAPNDQPGQWTLKVTELASNKSATKAITIR